MKSTCPTKIDPLATVQRFLASVAADTSSRSVVVSDEDGLVICGFGADERQAAIAAWCAAPSSARAAAHDALYEAGVDGPLHVMPVDLGGARVHLASDGVVPPAMVVPTLARLLG